MLPEGEARFVIFRQFQAVGGGSWLAIGQKRHALAIQQADGQVEGGQSLVEKILDVDLVAGIANSGASPSHRGWQRRWLQKLRYFGELCYVSA